MRGNKAKVVKNKKGSLSWKILTKGGVEVKNVKLCNILNVNKAFLIWEALIITYYDKPRVLLWRRSKMGHLSRTEFISGEGI